MTRQEAVELLNKFEFSCDFDECTNDWECEECGEALNMAIKALEREPKWIPCSERMPEEREWIGTEKFGTTISDKVLVTFESRGERFVKPMKFQNGELGYMDKHMMDAVYDEWKAVAWMPLPEPYEEAEQ